MVMRYQTAVEKEASYFLEAMMDGELWVDKMKKY